MTRGPAELGGGRHRSPRLASGARSGAITTGVLGSPVVEDCVSALVEACVSVLIILSFLHSFDEYLLHTSRVLATVLGAGDTLSEAVRGPARGADFCWRRQAGRKYTDK